MQSKNSHYVQLWGQEIETQESKGTHIKNVLKLDDQNITDDSNTGVDGLKEAEK